jgi:hypothetical protein
MQRLGFSRMRGKRGAWLAVALLPLLSGCIGAVALPLLAGGTLMATKKGQVRAATPVVRPPSAATKQAAAKVAAPAPPQAIVTSLTELPPPGGVAAISAEGPWRSFFAYALARQTPSESAGSAIESAILRQPPDIDEVVRLPCAKPVFAVIIDLDDASEAFAPERLPPAPAAIAEGLDRLRQAGIVVLWISRLPAARAGDVAQALQAKGFDPRGLDQLLLLRQAGDRKQLLRENANEDVCVVAIAGDERGDFDELFDYLRDPGSAVGLYPMMGDGWFLVPSLGKPAAASTER